MFPAMPPQGNKQERQLIKLYKSLSATDKEAFVAFGEFLQSREAGASEQNKEDKEAQISEPLDIPRPEEGESVIGAIKRLTATYPMVDKETILHPISNLMTAHMIQGRSAPEVIDDLQILFKAEYEAPGSHSINNNNESEK